MGSLLSGIFESMGRGVRPDAKYDFLLGSIFDGAIEQGLGDAVKDNDGKFPPEWRLSKSGRAKKQPNRKRKR